MDRLWSCWLKPGPRQPVLGTAPEPKVNTTPLGPDQGPPLSQGPLLVGACVQTCPEAARTSAGPPSPFTPFIRSLVSHPRVPGARATSSLFPGAEDVGSPWGSLLSSCPLSRVSLPAAPVTQGPPDTDGQRWARPARDFAPVSVLVVMESYH